MRRAKKTLYFLVSFLLLLLARPSYSQKKLVYHRLGIVRGDTTRKQIALVFTGDRFADGGELIRQTLKKHRAKASFFFTGNFYRNPSFQRLIKRLKDDGHYLGAHSDRHLLYCDWTNRDSLLVTKQEFQADVLKNYNEMEKFAIPKTDAPYFLPPYEWYNDSISLWTSELGLKLINFTPGTISHADYTTPEMKNYRTSESIFQSITYLDQNATHGLNGFILLLHIGTDPKRTDKFYHKLDDLLRYFKSKNYDLLKVNALLDE